MLTDFGIAGQQRLFNSSALVIGVGGLGCPVLQILVSSGIGKIGIVDFDIIEVHNLHRQFLFDENDVGLPKVVIAKDKLERKNSETKIETFNLRMTSKNAISVIDNFDVVVDCTDNFSTRYLINDACVLLKKPLVYASIFRNEGQVSVFNTEKDGIRTDYRDLFPVPPKPNEVPNCNEVGVLPAHSALIGTIQANEVIKVITDSKDILANQLLIFDSKKYQMMTIGFKENKEKSEPKTIEELQDFDYEEFCNINKMDEINSFLELQLFLNQEDSILMDVRNIDEHPKISIMKTVEIPLDSLEENLELLNAYKKICFICASGIRSRKAIETAKKQFPEKEIKHFSSGAKSLIQ